MNKVATSLVVLMASAVVGCGGGGGSSGGGSSGGGTSPTLSAFTSWSNVKPGERVVLTGDSQEATFSATVFTDSIRVDNLDIKERKSGAELIAGDISNGNLNYLKLRTAEGNIIEKSALSGDRFIRRNTAQGDSLELIRYFTTAVNSSGTEYIIFSDPNRTNFEYQTFGIWTTGGGTGNGKAGDFSVGIATQLSNMPTSGSAIYAGFAGGRYVDSNGNSYLTMSNLLLSADFTTGVVNFNTINTLTQRENSGGDGVFSANNNLDIVGSLNIVSGTNEFSGSATSSAGMAGNVNGKFYGPTANEVGGNFSLIDSGTNRLHVGAFGGKR